MAVMFWGAPYPKEAEAQDYLFTDRWPTIDLNPEDWRKEEEVPLHGGFTDGRDFGP